MDPCLFCLTYFCYDRKLSEVKIKEVHALMTTPTDTPIAGSLGRPSLYLNGSLGLDLKDRADLHAVPIRRS